MNHEQSTSLMAIKRTEATHGLTYTVAIVIGVTSCQSVNSIVIFSWLAVPVPKTLDWSLLTTAIVASACQRDGENAFIALTCSTCWTNVQLAHSYAGLTRKLHLYGALVYFLCDILWLKGVLCSVTSWWQPCACNCSTISKSTRSGSPLNAM